MKTIKFYILCIVGVLMLNLAGCDKFEDLNKDPNQIYQIKQSSSLLSPILYSIGSNNLTNARNIGHTLMQYAAAGQYENDSELHRYVVLNSTGSGYWGNSYRNLTNVEDMINVARDNDDSNYLAVGLTLRAYIYSMLTDLFGDVPFSEANKGAEGYLQPKFDSQQEIYTAILADLKTASGLFDTQKTMDAGSDILYKGSVIRWQKFCNSLRIRLLLRISSKVNTAKAELVNILIGEPVLSSADDDALLRYTNVSPFNNPYLSERPLNFYEQWAFCEFLVDGFNAVSDPRLVEWGTIYKGDGGGYKGIPSGYPQSVRYQLAYMTTYRTSLQSSDLVSAFITYSEVCFIKAELALNGEISGSAQGFYEDGIKASMDRWKLILPAEYLITPGVKFEGTNEEKMELIMLQKYYNFFLNDSQAWFEKRRTGLPNLPIGEAVQNDGKMPIRLKYPASVMSYNEANYKKVIEKMGNVDDINYRVWW